jgi:hypothetical protein
VQHKTFWDAHVAAVAGEHVLVSLPMQASHTGLACFGDDSNNCSPASDAARAYQMSFAELQNSGADFLALYQSSGAEGMDCDLEECAYCCRDFTSIVASVLILLILALILYALIQIA